MNIIESTWSIAPVAPIIGTLLMPSPISGERGHPHAFAGVEAAYEHRLQAEPEAHGQVPAEDFGNGFGSLALEGAAFEEDAHGGETQCPYGDHGGNQYAEHAREALPDFAVELPEVAFLHEARHVGVARDAYGEPEDRHQRVHHAVGVVEARDTACTEVRAETTDDEFQPEHGTHAKRHREHHLEVTHDIGMGRLDDKVVVHAATPGAENLEREEPDEGAHRHAPGEAFEAEVRAGVLTEREPGCTAADNRHAVADFHRLPGYHGAKEVNATPHALQIFALYAHRSGFPRAVGNDQGIKLSAQIL